MTPTSWITSACRCAAASPPDHVARLRVTLFAAHRCCRRTRLLTPSFTTACLTRHTLPSTCSRGTYRHLEQRVIADQNARRFALPHRALHARCALAARHAPVTLRATIPLVWTFLLPPYARTPTAYCCAVLPAYRYRAIPILRCGITSLAAGCACSRTAAAPSPCCGRQRAATTTTFPFAFLTSVRKGV